MTHVVSSTWIGTRLTRICRLAGIQRDACIPITIREHNSLVSAVLIGKKVLSSVPVDTVVALFETRNKTGTQNPDQIGKGRASEFFLLNISSL